MLRFFHRPLPGRLFVLLLVLVAVRVPLWALGGSPLTLAEFRQQLLGGRLGSGDLALYRGLFTTEAPLSAYLWQAPDLLGGGRSGVVYRGVAAALLLTQGLYFNYLLHRRGALAERSWLPLLLYGLVGAVWWELDALSPLLWGQTFMLLAFGNLTATSREGYDNRTLFQGGFLLGLAGLCYPPLLLFGLVGLLSIVFFAANAFRSSLLLLVGILFPYAALGTAYFYLGSLAGFIAQHLTLSTMWPFQPVALIPAALTWRVLAGPAVLLVVAGLRTLERGGQLNYQVRFRQVMLAWLGVAVVIVAAGSTFTPAAALLPFLPPLAYFAPALLGHGARAWLNEVLFGCAVGALLAVRYAAPLGLAARLPTVPAALRATVAPGQPDPARGVRDARLLILGEPDWRAYAANRPASPYFDWVLARPDFEQLATYGALYRLHQHFRTAPPTVLLDSGRRYVPTLRARLPSSFAAYREVRPGVWQRSSTNQ
ncbi:MAG: hypothetical protein H7330_12030 [Hymenobacteraceae bacterium]|nr:hypothetical protein [Hymenobacteraceae bacterium]